MQGIVGAQEGASRLPRTVWEFFQEEKVLELSSNKWVGVSLAEQWGKRKHTRQRKQDKEDWEAGNSMEYDPISHAALLPCKVSGENEDGEE